MNRWTLCGTRAIPWLMPRWPGVMHDWVRPQAGQSPAQLQQFNQIPLNRRNAVTRLLGASDAMRAWSFGGAAQLFALIQQRAPAGRTLPHVRAMLGRAPVAKLERVVPWRPLKPVRPLMIQHLCGQEVACEIGARIPAGGLSTWIFHLGMALTRAIDALGPVVQGPRWASPPGGILP